MITNYTYGTLEYKVFKTFQSLKQATENNTYSDPFVKAAAQLEADCALIKFKIFFSDDLERMGLIEKQVSENDLQLLTA